MCSKSRSQTTNCYSGLRATHRIPYIFIFYRGRIFTESSVILL